MNRKQQGKVASRPCLFQDSLEAHANASFWLRTVRLPRRPIRQLVIRYVVTVERRCC